MNVCTKQLRIPSMIPLPAGIYLVAIYDATIMHVWWYTCKNEMWLFCFFSTKNTWNIWKIKISFAACRNSNTYSRSRYLLPCPTNRIISTVRTCSKGWPLSEYAPDHRLSDCSAYRVFCSHFASTSNRLPATKKKNVANQTKLMRKIVNSSNKFQVMEFILHTQVD